MVTEAEYRFEESKNFYYNIRYKKVQADKKRDMLLTKRENSIIGHVID